jgi:hypothetical protein
VGQSSGRVKNPDPRDPALDSTKGRAQGTGHKKNFEFGNWNFEIKESQPKIRNPQSAIRNYLAMLYAL